MRAVGLHLGLQVNPTPFCDEPCKSVQVLGQFLGGKLYGIVLQVVSIILRIFHKDLSRIYHSLAKAEQGRANNTLFTYLDFKKELVDFSSNRCVAAPCADTEENALRNRYGSATIDHWLHIGTEEFPLASEKIVCVEKGICLGMSMDFIKSYFEKIEAGMTSMQAVRSICPEYAAGASDAAQLGQIFYHALDATEMREKKWELIQSLARKEREKIRRWFEAQKIQFPENFRKIKTQYKNQLERSKRKCFESWIKAKVQIEKQRENVISDQFGFQMGTTWTYMQEEIPDSLEAEFTEYLEDLPEGCYCAALRDKNNGHALTLIKTDSQYILFDPNFGTFIFEEDAIAEKLWDIFKQHYFKTDWWSFTLSLCEL